MTSIELRRSNVSRKTMAGHVSFAIVLLLVARFLWMRQQPERLAAPLTDPYTIYGEQFYMISNGGAQHSEAALQAQSLHDGGIRVISKVDARYQFDYLGPSSNFIITAGQLFYAVVPKHAERPSYFGSGVNVPDPRQFLGTFLSQPKGLPGGAASRQQRKHLNRPPALTKEVHIQQVSLHGGTPRNVVTLRTTGICLRGNYVFWIRPGPEDSVEVTQKLGRGRTTYWTEISPHSDLMLTSLTDGTTRRLRSGLPSSTYLTVEQSGVVWEEIARFPGRPTTFYACAADGSVYSLENAQKANWRPGGPLVEIGNRLYWTHASPSLGVMSANLDGTDAREFCALRENPPISNLLFHAYKGSLYCCITRISPAPNGNSKPAKYLCRLRPNRADPLDIMFTLPEASLSERFDGGYLYFYRSEQERSVWAGLMNDDANAESTTLFCRVPLDG